MLLEGRGLFFGVDGSIDSSRPSCPMNERSILWAQARKPFATIANKLQELDEAQLRSAYDPHSRHIARLNSASGAAAGKWLDAFPSSWWPEFPDDFFLLWHLDLEAAFQLLHLVKFACTTNVKMVALPAVRC